MSREELQQAIDEIEQSGLYGNQVHQKTLETALAALRSELDRVDPQPLSLEQLR